MVGAWACVSAAVAGNTAVIVPLFAALVTVSAPATSKKSAATPCRVKPASGVRVMVAIYTRPAPKVAPAVVPPLCAHVTVPVNCAVGVMAVAGVSPKAGGVTPCIALIFIMLGARCSRAFPIFFCYWLAQLARPPLSTNIPILYNLRFAFKAASYFLRQGF